MTNNKLMVCCICVNYKDLSAVFDSSLNNTHDGHLYTDLREKIFYCLGIKIDSNCNSNMICNSCIHYINQFYQYKLQAMEVKKFLEDISVLINPNAKAESITNYYRKLKQTINIPLITVKDRKDIVFKENDTRDIIEVRNIEIIDIDDDDNCNPNAVTNDITKSVYSESINQHNLVERNKYTQNSIQVINDDTPIGSERNSNNQIVHTDSICLASVPNRNEETLKNPIRSPTYSLKPNVMTVIPDELSIMDIDKDPKAAKIKSECFESLANQHGVTTSELHLIDKVIQESGVLSKISSHDNSDEFIEETTTQILDNIMKMIRVNFNNEKNVASVKSNISSEMVIAEEVQRNTMVLTKPVLVVKCQQPIYFCSYCERNFKFQIQLSHHIRKYHLNRCSKCNKSYNSSYSLIRHQVKNGCLINNSETNTTHCSKYADWKLNVKPILKIADFRNPSNGRADINKYTGKLQKDIFTAINYMKAESSLKEEIIELDY